MCEDTKTIVNKLKTKEGITVEYFDCECGDISHSARFTLFHDDSYPELYIDVYLNQYRGFFKRVWTAIKYVFGYRSKFGHFDSISFRRKDIPRLKELMNSYENEFDKIEKISNSGIPVEFAKKTAAIFENKKD